jgi:hypothetical protein
MYPTAVIGLVLFATAVQYARRPDRRRLRLVKHLSLLTGFVSTLGFVSGLVHAYTSCGDVEPGRLGNIVVVGTGESLVNVGFGLFLLVNGWIAASIGMYRSGGDAAGGAELADPHAH